MSTGLNADPGEGTGVGAPRFGTIGKETGLLAEGGRAVPDIVEECLERVRRMEPDIQAWVHCDEERTHREADRVASDLELSGLTVGIKDIIDTGDQPTSYGSAIYAGHRPTTDASCVARLRQAGAVVLGKTVTTEFAYFSPGKTRNPHDVKRTPGGSSSGSAAAVAAGMCHVALGTQTAGSVVRPASYCGIVGFKPTFGLIDLTGVKTLARSLDTLGILARSVSHAASVASVLARMPELARLGRSDQGKAPRFAFLRGYHDSAMSRSGRDALEVAFEAVSRSGGRPEWVDAPEGFDGLVEAQIVLMACEASDALAAEYAGHADLMSKEIKALIERGQTVGSFERWQALDTAAKAYSELNDLLSGFDVLVTLSAGDEAPEGFPTGDPVFNRAWTLLGVPAVSVPGMVGASGLPIGIQLVGRRREDRDVLEAAAWLESAFQAS